MDFKFAEQTCKMHAKLMILDGSKQIIVPDQFAWFGFNMLERDGELDELMRRKHAKARDKATSSSSKEPEGKPSKVKRQSGKLDTSDQEGYQSKHFQTHQPHTFVQSSQREYIGERCTLNGNPARIKPGLGIKAIVRSKTESYEFSWQVVDYLMRESGNFTFITPGE